MTALGGCRPVSGAHQLHLGRLGSASTYVTPPATDDSQAKAIVLPPLTGASTEEIKRRARTAVVATVPDWSGSTFAVWGGDPHDAIGAAGESLFGLQRRSGGGLGLVVPWGTDAPQRLAAGPFDVQRGFRDLKKALRSRVNLGGNDLPAALRRTTQSLPALGSSRPAAIFIPTDGIEAVTGETHAAVSALPAGSCHLLLIDPLNGCTPQMETDWRSVAFGSVTRIENLSVRDLATQMAETYAAALGLSLCSTQPRPVRRQSLLTRKKNQP